MTTKVFENILLNYLFMVLTMKQTAHGLVPEDIAVQLGEEVIEPWVLPPDCERIFPSSLGKYELDTTGVTDSTRLLHGASTLLDRIQREPSW